MKAFRKFSSLAPFWGSWPRVCSTKKKREEGRYGYRNGAQQEKGKCVSSMMGREGPGCPLCSRYGDHQSYLKQVGAFWKVLLKKVKLTHLCIERIERRLRWRVWSWIKNLKKQTISWQEKKAWLCLSCEYHLPNVNMNIAPNKMMA